jgi:hypothetical protein
MVWWFVNLCLVCQAAYDKIRDAQKKAAQRNSALDAKRRKLKEGG